MHFRNVTQYAKGFISDGGHCSLQLKSRWGSCQNLCHCVCRSELFSYETCIFYTVLTSVPTLDRVSLKSKVVDAPEILTVIESIPHLSTYLNALYKCQYADFFKASKSMTTRPFEGLLTTHTPLVLLLVCLPRSPLQTPALESMVSSAQ